MVSVALVMLVLGIAGALQAGRAGGRRSCSTSSRSTPALANVAPVLPDPHTPRLARRVFLVIIDGLRLDKSYELPFLDELRRRGVDTEAQSHYPTWSRPNYVSILTGVPPIASGVRTNHHYDAGRARLADGPRARRRPARSRRATDYDVLPRLFLRLAAHRARSAAGDRIDDRHRTTMRRSDIDRRSRSRSRRCTRRELESPFDDARYAPWPGGFSEAGDALAAGDADLVVMLLGAVDAAGHAHGGASPEYREAALIADHALARALATSI